MQYQRTERSDWLNLAGNKFWVKSNLARNNYLLMQLIFGGEKLVGNFALIQLIFGGEKLEEKYVLMQLIFGGKIWRENDRGYF